MLYPSSNWNGTNLASQLFIKKNINTRAEEVQFALNKLANEHKDPNEAEFGNERIFYMQTKTSTLLLLCLFL